MRRSDEVGEGWRIQTRVKLTSDGSLDGEITLINSNVREGFHGGAVILLIDRAGNVVHNAGLFRAAVSAAGPSSERTVRRTVHADVPGDRARQVEYLEVVHGHFPKDVGGWIKREVAIGRPSTEAAARIRAVAG